MRFSLIIKYIVSVSLHILAIGLIFFFFKPIWEWYLEHRPILGVDFYNTVTHARFIRDNFNIIPLLFKDYTYAGIPFSTDVLFLWFYVTGLVAKWLPLIDAVKKTMVVSFTLLLIFTYLASYRLSKNHIFSALISVLVAYSANMYGSLTWGGSLPYFANQLFFPAVLWLLASYIETGNRRWYFLGILFFGISFTGHLTNAGSFILPSSVILLILGQRVTKTSIKKRFVEVIIFFFGGYFLGHISTRSLLSSLIEAIFTGYIFRPFGFGGGSAANVSLGKEGISVTGDTALVEFERSRLNILFSDTNYYLFIIIGVFVIVYLAAFILDKEKKRALQVVPWFLIAIYSFLHVFLNSYGVSFLPQAWYRAYWHAPIAFGLFAASLVGYSGSSLFRLHKISGSTYFLMVLLASSLALVFLYIKAEVKKTIDMVEARSSTSSSHPQAINLVRNQEDLDLLSKKLIPDWIDPNENNYRLYTTDAQVNVWWNGVFDTPLVRGYIDPPIGLGSAGSNFLLDQAVGGDGLVLNFKYPEDIAKNMALYYIDWHSILYGEGGHLSQSPNKGPSSYLKDAIEEEKVIETRGAYILYETLSGKPEVWEHVPQYLNYYRFKPDLVSPIAYTTNTPSTLCLCDFPAYESLTKILSMNNINSRYLITAFTKGKIDDYSLDDLTKFDLLIVSGKYRYGNKSTAFDRLSKYVEGGGSLLIDTGSEVPESQGDVPTLFPFTKSERKDLGRSWELQIQNNGVVKDINFEDFSPPLYNNDPWKFSYPLGAIKSDSNVYLTQKGKPLLINRKLGKGEIIWSGMNLAYHVQSFTNAEESKLYLSLLSSLVNLSSHEAKSDQVEFISPREIRFSINNPQKGVILKMQNFPGWKVEVNGSKVDHFSVGPTFPGFIYIPLATRTTPIRISFKFRGDPRGYYQFAFSLGTLLILLEFILFDGNLFGKRASLLANKIGKKVGSWWEKEES